MMPPPDVDRLRAETPGCAHRIHFNNAGAGLMPIPVLAAMIGHLELEARIGGYEAADARADAVADFYDATGELLGCAASNVAFTANATDSFSRALSSIPFEPGDTILTTEDDYVSNQIAFLSLRKRFGVEVVRIPTLPEGGADPDRAARLMDELRPRLVAVTHVPTSSGLVQPVAEIGRHCRARDLVYLVDACQSVGQLPLDVEEIGCDFLSATCRKFLRGPRGAGLLYVSDRILGRGYEPLFVDMRGARWIEPGRYDVVETAARFEGWEFSYAAVIGAAVSARYALAVGLDWIASRTSELAADLRNRLAHVSGVRILDEGRRKAAIVTFTIEGRNAADIAASLAEEGINSSVSLREHARYDLARKGVASCVRLSPHYYNTGEETDRVVAAVADVAA